MHDGMCFLKPHDHNALREHIKKNQEEHRKKKDKRAISPSASTSDAPSGANRNSSSTSKLMLNDNLKAILCTNCCVLAPPPGPHL
eukprot:15347068-Ditylum_brightwellii.AAC.1